MYYAKSKPKIELVPHSKSVAEASLTALNSNAIARSVYPVSINCERLRSLSYLAALGHDLGKAHPAWQAACRQAIKTGADVSLPRHSSRSAFLVYALTDGGNTGKRLNQLLSTGDDGVTTLQTGLTEVERAALILAILHHHTQITWRNQQPDNNLINTSNLEGLIDNIGELELFEDWEIETDIPSAISGFKTTLKEIRRRKGTDIFAQIASLTTVLRSVLKQADHHASSRVQDGVTAPIPVMLSEDMVELFDYRPFQRAIDEELSGQSPPRSLCGIADCGAGKTQTAIQWGLEQQRAGNADRLVIAMPTRTTTNNLFHTITSDHVDQENVALHHSTSERIYTEQIDDERALNTINEYPRYSEWFQHPITVCTVDHLLATLVNNDPDSSTARGNLQRAAIVFDEIHAYDRQLLQKIIGAVDYFDERHIPWYVMTATCPPKLEQALNPTVTIRATDQATPYRITHHDTELDADTVVDELRETNARTAMVVKNTVREAQSLAKRLEQQTPPTIDIIYYSSEFPSYDRRVKERVIREQFKPGSQPSKRRILVSTQVCELSLDISVDTLHTDIAPIDALIQRAGRLHRHGTETESNQCECADCTGRQNTVEYTCHAYSDPNANSWYPYATSPNTDEWQLRPATDAVLSAASEYSFDHTQQWMDSVYSEYDMGVHESTFKAAIVEDALYGNPRWEGNRIPFRTQTQRRLTVVPSEYTLHDTGDHPVAFYDLWDEFHTHTDTDCGLLDDRYTRCHDELQKAVADYGIDIPLWWIQGSNSPTHITPLFPEAPRVSLREVPLSYSYWGGIRTPIADEI